MALAIKLTEEQFEYIKTTVKVDIHPKYGMHLRAKTLDEILANPYSDNLDMVKIRRSCGMTKGGFIREDCNVAKYIQYTTRYFGTRIAIGAHRLIYMLLNNINLEQYHIINHIDGNTYNNHISNLEIVSSQENSHISKSKYRQLNIGTKELVADDNGLYKVTFRYKNITYMFGTSKDKRLVEQVSEIITDIRINIPNSDELLIEFIDLTKYKTLEVRLSLIKINLFSDSYTLVYSNIKNFIANHTNTGIKQAGVRATPQGTFRVEIRVNSKTISFGTFDSIEEANSVAVEVRMLKNNDLDKLMGLINKKPAIMLAASYYRENIWRL